MPIPLHAFGRHAEFDRIRAECADIGALAAIADARAAWRTAAAGSAGTADPAPALPANAWVVTQTADGHLHVVSGGEATELVDDAADGAARPGGPQRPDRPDGPRARHRRRERPAALAAVGPRPTSFESAWSVTRGRGVKVAVIDSGVEANHQDLAGSVLPGIDYVQPRRRRSHRPQRSRHARRRHHRRARQQRARHRRCRTRRAHPSGARARRERRRRRLERRQGHHLGRRPRRPRHQPEPRWRRVAGHPAGDPVREQQGCRRGRGRRQQRRQPATRRCTRRRTPRRSRSPRSTPTSRTRSFGNTGSYIDVSAPGVGIVSAWGSSPTAYAVGDRHVDGDAVRVGRSRADHRREPDALAAARSRSSLEATATRPRTGGVDPSSVTA